MDKSFIVVCVCSAVEFACCLALLILNAIEYRRKK